jgi:hypothetical protein
MNALEATADSQAMWSATANRLKANYDAARTVTFGLSVGAALLATVASQLDHQFRLYLSIASAVMLGVVSLLSARLLSNARSSAWVRARAASEALKREAFKYAASAAPYDNLGSRESRLNTEREKVERDVEDLLGELVRTTGKGSSPRDALGPEDYIRARVEHQIEKYYLPKADIYKGAASTLHATEFGLSLLAAIITAAVGLAGKELLGGLRFDFVALTAVLTTIAGAILAHIEAARYDFLVMSYRAAARRLGNELARGPEVAFGEPADWSAFVERCEAIISEENNGWLAKWTSPTAKPITQPR